MAALQLASNDITQEEEKKKKQINHSGKTDEQIKKLLDQLPAKDRVCIRFSLFVPRERVSPS